MKNYLQTKHTLLAAGLFLPLITSAQAVSLRITVEAPSNVGLAPALLAFHDGSVDFFDTGSNASAGLESLAEVGDTSVLQGSLAASVDAITIANGGPFLPGSSNTMDLTINDANTNLSFAAMILPSNDWFIGNNASLDISSLVGAANGTSLSFDFGRVYDAGTELEDFAFSPGNGIIGIDTMSTPGGGTSTSNPIALVGGADPFGAFLNASPGTFDSTVYDFNSAGVGNTTLGRVSITVVPEPSALTLLGFGGLALILRRRK
jgi:hypothetical protein